MSMQLHPAQWWSADGVNAVRCDLCPRRCLIPEGKTGYCGVRRNESGELRTASYGYPVALQVDPIEKKPLRHFLPGTKIFSVGTFGCNLGCIFCQNDHLSRGAYDPGEEYRFFSPEELAELAIKHGCRSIAFTYNEPTVCAEYAVDTFRIARNRGLKTVLVTNGFISKEAADELYPLTDAANIDVKGFTPGFYEEMCAASLSPVLESCVRLKKEYGGHLEITNLVIPGKNSDAESLQTLLDWAAESLGLDTPIHFSAYFPAYKFRAPRTPVDLLRSIHVMAVRRGFSRVYLGNIG